MRILVILVLTPAFAAGVVAGAVGLIGHDSPVPQQPTTLVWGDRVFANRHDFAVWLERSGGNYERWAKRHPAAASVFAPRSGRRFAAASQARAAEANSQERQTQAGRGALFAATLLAIVLGIAALRPRLRRAHVAIRLPRRSRPVGTGDTVRNPPILRPAAIAVRPRPGSMSLRAPAANTLRHVRGIAVRERWNGVAGLALAGVERVHVGASAVVVRHLRRVHVAIRLPRRSRPVGTGDTVRNPPLLRHAAIAVRPRPGSMSLRAPAANTLRHVRGIAVRERWNGVVGLALAGVERVHVGAGAVVVRHLLRRYLATVVFYGMTALLALALGALVALYLN